MNIIEYFDHNKLIPFYSERGIEELTDYPNKPIFSYVIKEAEKLIGAATCSKADGIYILEAIAISEEYTGKKIGSKLLQQVFERLRQIGAEYVIINAKVFVEPTEDAVTNELFTVFDPSEQHGVRIAASNKLIKEYLEENGYKLVETGLTYNDDEFSSREELEEAMLDWWADIKVPTNDEEKREMISKIDAILEKHGLLKDLHVIEDVRYNVFKKEDN